MNFFILYLLKKQTWLSEAKAVFLLSRSIKNLIDFRCCLLLFCCSNILFLQAQHKDYGLIKKNTISDIDLINDTNYHYTRILVAGDILQEESHMKAAFNKDSNTYNYQNWFKQIRPVLFIGDIVIGNLETTFSGPPYSGSQYYSAPDEFLRTIKRSGFNVLMNANDKITDFDGYGINRTLNKLDEIGIRHTGAFRSSKEKEKNYPLMLQVHQIKVAILNYTAQVKKQVYTEEIFNKLSLSQIKKDIASAKSKGAEYILVYMHWGNEYDAKVLDYQKTIANTCIEYGADAIIGSNSHIFQPIEIREVKRNNKTSQAIIAYSLGDFLPSSSDPLVNNSAILEIMLKKHKKTGEVFIEDFGYIPIWTQIDNKNFTVLPITNIDENEILNIKLNYKEYTDAKTAINGMRGIMFEKMEEIHYNLSDKIVEDVDQTFLLQKDNPSLAKVAEKTFKDSLSKSQIAYIELFGTKEEKEKLLERNKSAKEVEDARILAFKNQIRKKEQMRKSQEEIVAQFNTPIFEKKTIKPQIETENVPVRLPSPLIKVDSVPIQIAEIDRSETLFTMNQNNKNKTNTPSSTENNMPTINPNRKNNFQEYPKTPISSNNIAKSEQKAKDSEVKSAATPQGNQSKGTDSIANQPVYTAKATEEKNESNSTTFATNFVNSADDNKSTNNNQMSPSKGDNTNKYSPSEKLAKIDQASSDKSYHTETTDKKTNAELINTAVSTTKKSNPNLLANLETKEISKGNNKNSKNIIVDKNKISIGNKTISAIQKKTKTDQSPPSTLGIKSDRSKKSVHDEIANLKNNSTIDKNTTVNATALNTSAASKKSITKVNSSQANTSKNKTNSASANLSNASTKSKLTESEQNINLEGNTTPQEKSIRDAHSNNAENAMAKTSEKPTTKNNNNTASKESLSIAPATKSNSTKPSETQILSENKSISTKSEGTIKAESIGKEPLNTSSTIDPVKGYSGSIGKITSPSPSMPLSNGYSTSPASGIASQSASGIRTTKVVSQIVDSSGKVQTIIRRLEVVNNKPTANLPYRPKTGGGIFTASEPTAPSTTNLKSIPTAPPTTKVTKTNIEEEAIYYVQVYAFSEKYNINTELNPSLKYYEVVIEDNQYKYLVGKSKNVIQVAKLCEELREKGYADAFMVKYVNGKRVPFVGN